MGSTTSTSKQRVTRVAAGLAGLAVFVGWLLWWSRPPQMGADAEVSNTVDALFTAVNARDERLLAECARQLQALREARRLPPDAWAYLDDIIRKARTGAWESSAHALYDFVRAQRRGGASAHPRREKHRAGSAKK